MATSFASFKNSAPGLSPVRISPMASASKHILRIVSPHSASVSARTPESDLQIPLNRLVAGRSTREYPTGGAIFSQGDPANSVFYIQNGRVKLIVVSASGKEAVIAHLPMCSFFGEASLAGQAVRISSASALEPSTVIRIDREAMQNLLQSEPDFAQQFLAHLLARNIRMEADLVDHLFNSSEKRLARLLMLMANFGEGSEPIPVIAKVSQETLAEMIGTTRSRVSFFLNRFRDLGYIDYDCAGMRIKSSLANVVLHD